MTVRLARGYLRAVTDYLLRWRTPLTLARRDLTTNIARTSLLVLVVGLPISVGVVAVLFQFNSVEAGERLAQQTMGEADGVVRITPYSAVSVRYESDGSMSVEPIQGRGGENAGHRGPPVDSLPELLPKGSRWTPEPFTADLVLAGGGTAEVTELDLADPLTRGLADLTSGSAPSRRGEVAVTQAMAAEFGFLGDDSKLRADASLELGEAQMFRVVGVLSPDDRTASGNPARLVVAPGHPPVRGNRSTNSFLVGLPHLGHNQLQELVTALAAQGVALMPRDALLDPDAWDVRGDAQTASDARALAIGVLVVLGGLVEVLMIVGAVFAVGARRSVRRLGLLAANGGTRADARKHLIAPGMVIGVSAAVLGSGAGIGLFFALAPRYESATGEYLLRGVDWLSIAVVALLGSLTAVLAALPPAFTAARMDPVQAMSGGRTPLSEGHLPESKLGMWPVPLAGVALSLLAVAGVWIAREFSLQAHSERPPSSVPVVLGSAGVLLMAVSAIGAAPALATSGSKIADSLWLSARIAVRDAGRNRMRTAAATVAVGLVVAASIFVSAGANAAVERAQQDPQAPTRSVVVYLGSGANLPTPSVTRVAQTLRVVLGTVEVRTAYRIHPVASVDSTLVIPSGDIPTEIRAVDETTLKTLVGNLTSDGLQVFRAGGVVTTEPRRDESNTVPLAILDRDGDTTPLDARPVAWEEDRGGAGIGDFSTAWVSISTAKALGLRVIPTSIMADAHAVITRDQVDRLALRGISAYAPDTDTDLFPAVAKAALVLAGLLTMLVSGTAVALTSFERRDDAGTMTAMGATPMHRRTISAMEGGFVGLLGLFFGVLIGLPGSLSLGQLDGVPGTAMPITATALLGLPLLTAALGFMVVPGRVSLTRRAD